MLRSAFVTATALALAALAGCGSSGGPAAYWGTYGNGYDYIQWQQSSSGALYGTITVDRVSGKAPTLTLSSSTNPFTGKVNGSSVSITFRRPFGITAHVVGIISGNSLILQLPQSNGLIDSAGFNRGDRGAFNKFVAGLRRQIRAVNAKAARA